VGIWRVESDGWSAVLKLEGFGARSIPTGSRRTARTTYPDHWLAPENLAMIRVVALNIDAAIQAFYEVREMRYAIDEAHDADGLVAKGAGDCLAKAELLARRLGAAALSTRLVR